MSFFNVPGIYLLWNNEHIIQTRFKSIYQIPIMTLDKQQITIPSDKKSIAFLHFKNSQKCASIYNKMEKLNNYSIYCIPDQNSKQDHDTIKKNNPNSLGKMVINGPRSHPLLKFLKRNSFELYDHDVHFTKKNLNDDVGLFLYNGKTAQYYSEKEFDKFFNKKQQNQKFKDNTQNK